MRGGVWKRWRARREGERVVRDPDGVVKRNKEGGGLGGLAGKVEGSISSGRRIEGRRISELETRSAVSG